jgi:hypothetical protein
MIDAFETPMDAEEEAEKLESLEEAKRKACDLALEKLLAPQKQIVKKNEAGDVVFVTHDDECAVLKPVVAPIIQEVVDFGSDEESMEIPVSELVAKENEIAELRVVTTKQREALLVSDTALSNALSATPICRECISGKIESTPVNLSSVVEFLVSEYSEIESDCGLLMKADVANRILFIDNQALGTVTKYSY